MSRRPRLGGKHDRAIVPAELGELRIEFRIKPVGLDNGCLEVVDHERVRNTAEVFEGISMSFQPVLKPLAFTSLNIGVVGSA